MTATADFMNSTVNPGKSAMMNAAITPAETDASQVLSGVGFKLIGVALILGAVGMWLAPGASWSSELLLIKLVMSLISMLAGVALLQNGQSYSEPEIEFDQIRREMRVVRLGKTGEREVMLRRAYNELGAADASDGVISIWDADSKLLVSLPVKDSQALKSLGRQLSSLIA